jgi:DNA-3-methyladenine glycosylase I
LFLLKREGAMDERTRCGWANGDALMAEYHDREWGVPVRDPRLLWEMLMLEGFQAGLSWSIILKRREGFHSAFAGWDPDKVAAFGPSDVERLMLDPGIIRARAKIEGAIGNARAYLARPGRWRAAHRQWAAASIYRPSPRRARRCRRR